MLVITREVIRRFGTASVTVDALVINKIFSSHVVGPLLRLICHDGDLVLQCQNRVKVRMVMLRCGK